MKRCINVNESQLIDDVFEFDYMLASFLCLPVTNACLLTSLVVIVDLTIFPCRSVSFCHLVTFCYWCVNIKDYYIFENWFFIVMKCSLVLIVFLVKSALKLI